MKKRLSKPLWYGIGVDSDGNPIVPKPATSPDDLEGLHEGELFLHLKEGIVTLWSLSADGAVVEISGGGGVDLSQYLLKSVWDKVWEIKTDPQGNEYIFGKLPLVTQYGITMYADDSELDLPSIYAGLPIDNQTLYWENGVLKAKAGTEGAITSITSAMVVDALGYIPANGSDVTALQNKVNDFLLGSDTDTIINKWKELESFLSGMSESDNLATILGNKANKATTLEGYGITDAYTKTKVDELLGNYVTVATAQTITGEKNFTGGLKVNGSPIVYDTTNRYWKLEGDLLVTGGITMYASDSGFEPSTVMDAIAVDGTTISKANGYLEVIGGTGGGLTEVHWDNVIGRPTLLSSFTDDVVAGKYLPLTGGTVANSGFGTIVIHRSDGGNAPGISYSNDADGWLGGIGIGGSSSSIRGPIYIDRGSVVYSILHDGNYSSYALPLTGGKVSGAIQFTKIGNGSYNVGEIGVFAGVGLSIESPLAEDLENSARLPIVLTWRGGYDNKGGLKLTGKDSAELGGYKIWHAGNFAPSNYLPLTGGTVANSGFGTIVIHRSDGGNAPGISYSNDADGWLGGIGIGGSASSFRGQPIFIDKKSVVHKIWHSGNDGSDSGLDADTLDGLQPSALSVLSASKLTTARTIWGRSFDGTGNVDGNIVSANETFNVFANTTKELLSYSMGNKYLSIGYSTLASQYTTYIHGYNIILRCGSSGADGFILNSSGNVGIGTTTPSYKLHVNGTFGVSGEATFLSSVRVQQPTSANYGGYLYFGDASYCYIAEKTDDAMTIYASNGVTLSTNLLVTGGITMYSDKRKKVILNHVELTLQQIANAPLVEHYYNSDENKTTHVSSIAQYWAGLNDWFCKLDSEGFYTMEIQNAALASAISIARELMKYESETDKKISLLEREVKRLKEEIRILKTA